ncbi:MAG: TonB-dependent receptor [Longimicrobiales bacterium]
MTLRYAPSGLLVLLLPLLVLFPRPLGAQTGGVAGVVVDAATGLTLAGATVRAPGVERGAVSDRDGRFSLLGLPTGSHRIVAEYLGYGTAAQMLTIRAGALTGMRFVLEGTAIEVEGVTVVGRRRGQAAALNQQLNAANITNVVAADQIGRFPDANIGDAMKRIPGIVVLQDQGEARFGAIRGTEPRLNSVMVNGERIPSAEAEVREVQLDLIPSDMVSAIEVSKALTPDMDADAIGGAVNIVTRSAPDSRRVSATVGSGFNFLAEEPMGVFSGVFAERFADERVGLVVSGSYNNHRLGSDNIEAEWDEDGGTAFVEEFQIREYQVQRIRRSASASLDWRLDRANTLTWRSLYNHRDDFENRFRAVYGLDGPGTTVAEIERQTKAGTPDINNARREDQRMQTHSLSGLHVLGGGGRLDWSAQFAQASEDRPNERYMQFVAEGVPVSADITNPRKPFVTVLDAGAASFGNFELDEITEEHQYTRDRDLNLRADLTVPLGAIELKIGGRLRDKSKLRDNDFFEYSPLGTLESLADARRRDYSNPGFLAGNYRVGEFATEEYLGGLDLDGTGFEREAKPDEFLPGNFEADERIAGGYVMLTRSLSPAASLVAGLRVENTAVDYVGYEFVEDDESSRQLKGSKDYTNLFPSLHLRYDLGGRRLLRAAWSNTISRPNYYDLVPYRIVNQEDDELEVGNPDLEPTRSMNLDLMYEQYLASVGLVSAGVFYKDIRDFIFGFTREDVVDPASGRTFGEVTRPENGAEASLFGFEVALQAPLAAGFGIYGNYTFTESSVDGLPIPGREDEDLPLPGTSRHTANASLSYEGSRMTLRASLNFQDDFIDPGELGDEAFFDRFYDRATTLDLNGEFVLTPSARFFFEANNLTNQPLRYFQGVRERLMQEEFYDIRFQAGVKVDLR